MKLTSTMLSGRYLNEIVQLTRLEATYTTVRTVITTAVHAVDDYDRCKPFSSIPGPRGLPYFGTLFYYKADERRISRYHETILERYKRYGPIYRETIAGETVVHLLRPDYIQTVYQNEGKIPYLVPLLETAQRYRRLRQMSPGLGNTNGEEWYRLRSGVQRLMLDLQSVGTFLPLINPVADDFVQRIREIRDPDSGIVESLYNEIAKWNLESSATTCFETRLGCIDADKNSWHQRMIDSNVDIFQLSLKLQFSLQFYKLFRTTTWRKLIEREDFFLGNGQKLVDETADKIRHQPESSGHQKFLSTLLSRQDLSYKDVSIITLSLFTDGLSTTVPSMVGQLYCLASNPDKQQKLYDEIMQLAPDKQSPITYEVLQRATYLKACIKEGFRLFPIGVDVSRIPQKNLAIGGYQVPAGTHLSLNNNLLLRLPQYFKDPEKFIPERWIRDEPVDNVHPYLLIPFSFGARTCAGMRLAEQEMRMLIIKLLQNFRLDWPETEPELRQQYVMLLKPDRPASIQFIPRN